jgi:hypothetical protein
MNIPTDRHVPVVAEPITKAQSTNYADILKELEKEQQQQQSAPQAPPPTTVQQQQAPQAPPPVVRFAEPLVETYAPVPPSPPVHHPMLPVDKGPIEDSFFVRYRRHLFVAAVAFAVVQYASPYLSSVPYMSNGLARSAATAALIAGLFYAGDLFILSPETIVEVAR